MLAPLSKNISKIGDNIGFPSTEHKVALYPHNEKGMWLVKRNGKWDAFGWEIQNDETHKTTMQSDLEMALSHKKSRDQMSLISDQIHDILENVRYIQNDRESHTVIHNYSSKVNEVVTGENVRFFSYKDIQSEANITPVAKKIAEKLENKLHS